MYRFEQQYPNQIVAGVDEAGRGPMAGPVVASAVIVNQNKIIPGIKDSKKLSFNARQILYNQITTHYIYSTYIVSPAEIDQINILEATKKACELAVKCLNTRPDIVLVDGNMKFTDQRFISIIKGDNLSVSIAAASIVAKVTRDHLMIELDKEYPEYLWRKNFGYGTKAHLESMEKYGITMHHRKSFKKR
jgi:ribonuclease HII